MQQKEKLKRKRVPNNYWQDIQARYNTTYSKSSSISALQTAAWRGDLKILEIIADVVQEKQQKAISEAQRIEAKLISANMILDTH
jgi:hypothetical protein